MGYHQTKRQLTNGRYTTIWIHIIKSALKLRAEASWVFWGQIGTAVGGLLTVKVLTFLMTPAEYGKLAIANTIVLFISANLFGPLGQGLMRFWSINNEKGRLFEYLQASKNLILYIFLVISLLSVLFLTVSFHTRLHNWSILGTLAILLGAFTGWMSIRANMLMAARKRKAVALINGIGAFLKPAFAAILILSIISSASVVMVGFLLTTVLIVWFLEKYYREFICLINKNTPEKNHPRQHYREINKEIINFSWPFFIWGIFSWVHQSSDRWAIQIYQGSDVLGGYSVIAQLALFPIVLGSGFLSTFFLPIAYDRGGVLNTSNSIKSANKIIVTMIVLYLVCTAILIGTFSLYHRQIVVLISNKHYADFSNLLPGLTVAWTLFFLGQMLSGFGLLANKPKAYIAPVLVSGVSAAFFTFYFASIKGPPGAVLGLCIAGFIYASWFLVIAFRLSSPQNLSL